MLGALLVMIAAAAGCATEDTDAQGATPTLITAASEAEAMAALEALVPPSGGPGTTASIACDHDRRNGICCFTMPDGSVPCVAW